MMKKSNPDLPVRVIALAGVVEAISLLLIFVFTKSAIYCIISLAGALISIAGFALLIKSTDRMLKEGKGKVMFFVLAQVKLLVIALVFYLLSLLTGDGVVFFVQGVAVVYLAVVLIGLLTWSGKLRNGT
jgi:hypothetical protein